MGKVLPKPVHLLQQEQHGVSAGSGTALLSSSSTMLVLWLPSNNSSIAGSQEQVTARDRDKEDSHMQPANNRVLALGWAYLQEFKQVKNVHGLHAHAERHAMDTGDLADTTLSQHLFLLATCQSSKAVVYPVQMFSGQTCERNTQGRLHNTAAWHYKIAAWLFKRAAWQYRIAAWLFKRAAWHYRIWHRGQNDCCKPLRQVLGDIGASQADH